MTKQAYVRGKVTKSCKTCNASFTVFNCELSKTYCSIKCLSFSRKGGVGYWKNKKRDAQTLKKMSDGRKGISAWNKGTKGVMKAWNKGMKAPWSAAEKNVNWKGDKVGYRALHEWIEGQLGKPTTCEFCLKENLTGHEIHWANKSWEYRRDVSDWIRLCPSCHKAYDMSKIHNNTNL